MINTKSNLPVGRIPNASKQQSSQPLLGNQPNPPSYYKATNNDDSIEIARDNKSKYPTMLESRNISTSSYNESSTGMRVVQPQRKAEFSRCAKATVVCLLTTATLGGLTFLAYDGHLYGLGSHPRDNNFEKFTTSALGHITNATFNCIEDATYFGLCPDSYDVVRFCDGFTVQQNKFAYLTGEVTSLNYEVSVLNQNLTDVETLLMVHITL